MSSKAKSAAGNKSALLLQFESHLRAFDNHFSHADIDRNSALRWITTYRLKKDVTPASTFLPPALLRYSEQQGYQGPTSLGMLCFVTSLFREHADTVHAQQWASTMLLPQLLRPVGALDFVLNTLDQADTRETKRAWDIIIERLVQTEHVSEEAKDYVQDLNRHVKFDPLNVSLPIHDDAEFLDHTLACSAHEDRPLMRYACNMNLRIGHAHLTDTWANDGPSVLPALLHSTEFQQRVSLVSFAHIDALWYRFFATAESQALQRILDAGNLWTTEFAPHHDSQHYVYKTAMEHALDANQNQAVGAELPPQLDTDPRASSRFNVGRYAAGTLVDFSRLHTDVMAYLTDSASRDPSGVAHLVLELLDRNGDLAALDDESASTAQSDSTQTQTTTQNVEEDM